MAKNKALKWDFKRREYVDYVLPDECALMSAYLSDIVSCAECGHKLEYGDSYTSLKIHNSMGFGYPVCSKCYEKELKERENSK